MFSLFFFNFKLIKRWNWEVPWKIGSLSNKHNYLRLTKSEKVLQIFPRTALQKIRRWLFQNSYVVFVVIFRENSTTKYLVKSENRVQLHLPIIRTDPLGGFRIVVHVVQATSPGSTFLPSFGQHIRAADVAQRISHCSMAHIRAAAIAHFSRQQRDDNLALHRLRIVSICFAQIQTLIWKWKRNQKPHLRERGLRDESFSTESKRYTESRKRTTTYNGCEKYDTSW